MDGSDIGFTVWAFLALGAGLLLMGIALTVLRWIILRVLRDAYRYITEKEE